jgi:hypothetical protein
MAQRGNPEKGGEASLRSPKVSAAELQMYLKGINYPADKQRLIQTARSNGATQQVMDFINRMPSQQYSSPIDVEKAFSRAK